MCVVSMIGDHYSEKWTQPPYQNLFNNFGNVTREDFENLVKEVKEMKALLKRAKEYDIKNNEPNCEIEEKIELLKKIAKLVNIDLNDIK